MVIYEIIFDYFDFTGFVGVLTMWGFLYDEIRLIWFFTDFFYIINPYLDNFTHVQKTVDLHSKLSIWFPNENMTWSGFRRTVELTILNRTILLRQKFRLCYFTNQHVMKRLSKLVLYQYQQVLKAKFWCLFSHFFKLKVCYLIALVIPLFYFARNVS